MKSEQFILVAALSALLTSTWLAVRRTQRRRQQRVSKPRSEALQTWEGEGGNVVPTPPPG